MSFSDKNIFAAPKPPTGMLVVFEGIDGTGKSTQVELAHRALRERGYRCEKLKEPTDGEYGTQLRKIAIDGREHISPEKELELFVNDRREDVEKNIIPALERSAVVLLDRYYFSTMAYQGARGVDMERIRRENEAFAPRPDIVVYLDIPVEVSGERIENHRNDSINLFEKRHYLEQVKQCYDLIEDEAFVRIDATRPVDEVHKEILEHILSRIAEHKVEQELCL